MPKTKDVVLPAFVGREWIVRSKAGLVGVTVYFTTRAGWRRGRYADDEGFKVISIGRRWIFAVRVL